MLESNQQNPKIPANNKKKLLFVGASVLVVALAIGLTVSILMSGQNPSNNQTGTSTETNSQSWMKVGAYATYDGHVSIMGIDVSFNARMEIINLNQTHIQVSTDYNMSTPYGATENKSSTWVSRQDMTFQPPETTLNSTYTTEITLAKIGTRSCTVYEYSSEGLSATYYVDNAVHWPVKMVMTSPTSVDGQSYNMDINLVDSNIPGL
jgi:hypothetical protein